MSAPVDREVINRLGRILVPNRVLVARSMVDLADVPDEPGGKVIVQYSQPVCEEFHSYPADESHHAYMFRLVTGLRFLDAERCEREGADPEECVMGLITAEFCAYYHSETEEPCPDSDLEEFSKQNAIYHVWPYWREFNQSACFRAGITPPPIGVFMIDKFGSSRES